jgi:hypothetical protein
LEKLLNRSAGVRKLAGVSPPALVHEKSEVYTEHLAFV